MTPSSSLFNLVAAHCTHTTILLARLLVYHKGRELRNSQRGERHGTRSEERVQNLLAL